MSPEILKGNYKISTDIWSAGVILYIMLSGYPPFYAESETEIFKKILIGNFSFRGQEWRNISNSAKDLIRNMLIVNTELRLTAEQVLEHPWLLQSVPMINFSLAPETIETFQDSSRLRKVALLCIATHTDQTDVAPAKDVFLFLDTDCKGIIKTHQLQNSLVQYLSSPCNLNSYVQAMDLNNSNKIEYTQFVAGIINSQVYLNQQKLVQTFQILDSNSNGHISVDDLQKIIGNHSKKAQAFLQEILNEAKFNSGLGFDDFVRLVSLNK
jgi:calcium-dependent protein kinase